MKNNLNTPSQVCKIFENIKYPFTASMARRRFWMVNALLPNSPDGKSLKKAIELANASGAKILDIGCGDRPQALLDLRNNGFNNLYGIDMNVNKQIKGLNLKKNRAEDIDFPDRYFDGVVFSAYVFPHIPLQNQLRALEEIDRITGKGCRGYLGPFSPQVLVKSSIAKQFPEYKNPLFGYVESKKSKKDEEWILWKSWLTNLGVYAKPNNNIYAQIYRSRIPLYMAYFLSIRGLLNKILPNTKVTKDYKSRMPFEYFITFIKK